MPYADRINGVLDHIFGRAPGVTSIERNRDILRLLAGKLRCMQQTQSIAVSDMGIVQGSESRHGEQVVPSLSSLSDNSQWTNAWQPDMYFGHSLMNDPDTLAWNASESWAYPNTNVMPGYQPPAMRCSIPRGGFNVPYERY